MWIGSSRRSWKRQYVSYLLRREETKGPEKPPNTMRQGGAAGERLFFHRRFG